ncbi:MAG: hypothetical protein R3B47_15100 [Bacteroidia bacterium]
MDHFALPEDSLSIALPDEGTLHRNFMGYTPVFTPMLIGAGSQVMPMAGRCLCRMKKRWRIISYRRRSSTHHSRSCLTDEDLVLRRHLLDLMCRFEMDWSEQPAAR